VEPLSETGKQKLLAQAQELEQLASELRTRLDPTCKASNPQAWWLRFASSNRRDFWRMPAWLWVPLVVLLYGVFVVALLSASR